MRIIARQFVPWGEADSPKWVSAREAAAQVVVFPSSPRSRIPSGTLMPVAVSHLVRRWRIGAYKGGP